MKHQDNLYLSQRNIYGSARIGTENVNQVIASTLMARIDINSENDGNPNWFNNLVGDKRYELTNHLGNVLQVITDVKLEIQTGPSTGVFSHFSPDVVSQTTYYPFGMEIPNLSGTDEYRYGFQGQEKDDEIKGEGNSINYSYRMHDSRIGRFFAVDPLASKYPHNSVYAFSENRVIDGIELEGLEVFVINGTLGPDQLVAANDGKPGTYSELITHTSSDDGTKTIAEIYGNSEVIRHIWPGHNNSQARLSESDCLFETITANHIEGEPITIVGHSHGGNVAILAAQQVYEYYKEQGIHVEINLITLNTPYVIGAGYELSEEASKNINWIEVYNPKDMVVPHAGFSETGALKEGGETASYFGEPDGEKASTKKKDANKAGSTRLQHPQADTSIEYKDKYKFRSRGEGGGPKTWLVGHRGWLPENAKQWVKKVDKVVNKTE